MTRERGVLRVVLADDHHLSRQGLRGMLEEDGVAVVGEAAESGEAAALVASLQPDVVVLDLRMPGASPAETIGRIATAAASARVLVLTAEAEDVLEALAAGADGYLLKDSPADELLGAIRQAASGSAVLSRPALRALLARLERLPSEADTAAPQAEQQPSLSAREQEVLRLLAAGADNAEIGRRLSISRHTAKQHVTNIFAKLGVSSRVQAAVRAVRDGLV